jgi:hypothetical protein
VAARPVPTLFPENPKRANHAMENGSLLAFKELEKIYKKFFVPANVTIIDAISLVRKPW